MPSIIRQSFWRIVLGFLLMKNKFLIFAWGLYDLANQFFALNIVSLYFVRWVTFQKQTPELFYSIPYGISMFLVGFLAPFLGNISDLVRRHRLFLALFTLLSVVFTIGLGFTENVFLGLAFFAVANFGCQSAIIFYNALMINVVSEGKIGLVSGIGKMMGYCGAILGLYIIRPLVLRSGYQAAFIPSGLLFFIFALPCMLLIKDRPASRKLSLSSFLRRGSFAIYLKRFFRRAYYLLKSSGLSDFLKASFFCLCVVNIIILFMSVYATRVFELAETQLINFVMFSTLFAIVGSLFSGYISDRIGYKRSLMGIFFLWAICLLSGGLARSSLSYWFIGPLVGFALGSTWVVSRALVIRIVPAQKMGQVFGLFNLVGYLSAIVGALFWGGLVWFLAPLGALGYRIALLSLILFLVPGFIYLRRIK